MQRKLIGQLKNNKYDRNFYCMGKWNCCVPGCTNNWRNSPDVTAHRIPADAELRKEYDRLIRNDNLKISSSSTRICGAHFPGGERASV